MCRRDIFFIFLTTLLLALPASYEPHHFAKALFLGSFFQSLAFAFVLMWLTKRCHRCRMATWLVLFLLFVVETFTYLRFDSRFNPGILVLVLQTNWREMREFFSVYVLTLPSMLLLLNVVVVLLALLKVFAVLSEKPVLKCRPSIVVSVAAILFGLLLPLAPLPFPIGNNTLVEFFKSVDFVFKKHEELSAITQMVDRVKVSKTPEQKDAPLIVLVIGESFNKHHASVYGYGLPTTPTLATEKEQGRLLVYDGVKSSTNGTNVAMRLLFSLESCNSAATDSSRFVLMPVVFKKAGYKVAYFDNQYTRSSGGELDYSCGYFLNPPYINSHSFDYRNDELFDYDGDFIEHYADKFLKASKSLNIIHLMGQHFDASKRYPEAFRKFTAADVKRSDLSEGERSQVAEYDNATRYNDHVLARIFQIFAHEDAVVVYLSDHGEQIYDGKAHYFGRMFGSLKDPETLTNVYEVPFLVWCSDKYRTRHADQYEALRSMTSAPLCHDDTSYLLFHLAGIDFNYNNERRCLLHPYYTPHQPILE